MKRNNLHSTIYRDGFKNSSRFKDGTKNSKNFSEYAGIRKWAALINNTEFGHKLIDKISTLFPKFASVPNNIFWLWNRFKDPNQYYKFADDHKWIFIIGCNNSGTTLLHDLLGFHADIASFPLEGQCLTRTLPRTLDFEVGRIWTEKIDLFTMTEADQQYNSARLIHDWKNYLDNINAPTILEKTPVTVLRSRWFQKVFKNSYFIGISRDGRAVAEGISRRKEGVDFFRALAHWLKVNECLLDNAKYLKNYKHVRYEELVGNPQQILSDVMTFINVDQKNYKHDFNDKLVIHNINEEPTAVTNFNQKSFDRIPKEIFDQLTDQITPMMQRLGYKEFQS